LQDAYNESYTKINVYQSVNTNPEKSLAFRQKTPLFHRKTLPDSHFLRTVQRPAAAVPLTALMGSENPITATRAPRQLNW
jgi:hypothetical protein